MPALSRTDLTSLLPLGDGYVQVYRVTTGARATNEWIATELESVEAILSYAIVNTATLAAPGATYTATEQGILDDSHPVQFKRNAQGHAASEGANLGDLAVFAGRIVTVEVAVFGRRPR